jgi:hypothetical protein
MKRFYGGGGGRGVKVLEIKIETVSRRVNRTEANLRRVLILAVTVSFHSLSSKA